MNLIIDPVAAVLDKYDLDELYKEVSFKLRKGYWLSGQPAWVVELWPYFVSGRKGTQPDPQVMLDTVVRYIMECAMSCMCRTGEKK